MVLNQLISSTPLRQIHEGKYKKDEEKFVKKLEVYLSIRQLRQINSLHSIK